MAARKPKNPQPEALKSNAIDIKVEPVVKASVVKAKAFDPDSYLANTYGEMYDIVAVQRAILHELVLIGHKG